MKLLKEEKLALAWVIGCLIVALLSVSYAVTAGAAPQYRERDCVAWAKDAVHGGAQALRGKKRAIREFKRGSILKEYQASRIFQIDGIAVFEGEYSAEAVFYGYDYVKARMGNRASELPQSAKGAYTLFYSTCTGMANV